MLITHRRSFIKTIRSANWSFIRTINETSNWCFAGPWIRKFLEAVTSEITCNIVSFWSETKVLSYIVRLKRRQVVCHFLKRFSTLYPLCTPKFILRQLQQSRFGCLLEPGSPLASWHTAVTQHDHRPEYIRLEHHVLTPEYQAKGSWRKRCLFNISITCDCVASFSKRKERN
jgi:hypothetical protein